MRGLKELPHSCFSFLLQISSKPFSVKDYQLIQYLIPVPVSLRPLFDYVLAGKIQHLFQCRIAWEYAEYSCAVTPQVRQTGNRLSGLAGTAYASLLA